MKCFRWKKFCLMILLAAAATLTLCLSACFGEDSSDANDPNRNPAGSENQEQQNNNKNFINAELLGYVEEYVSKDGMPERGFLLYDTAYFSRIYFENISIDRWSLPTGELYYDGEKILDFKADASTQKFFDIPLDFGAGCYRCDISVQTNGEQKKESFEFGVGTGGRPNEVRFTVTEDGREVAECVGNTEYTVTAQLYSEGELLEDYLGKVSWENGENGGDSMRFSEGKLYRTVEYVRAFQFTVEDSQGYIRKITKEFQVTVGDNLDRSGSESGIYVNFGADFNGTIKANRGTNLEFWRTATAEYRFTDGTLQSLSYAETIDGVGNNKDFYYRWEVSYDGEEYKRYRAEDYDYSLTDRGNWNVTYYGENVRYQLNPAKDSAKLRVVLWDGTESSPIDVQIGKTPVTSLEITGITGRRKEQYTPSPSVKSLCDYTATATVGDDGEKYIEAVVACDWNGDDKVTADEWGKVYGNSASDRNRKQYFFINVKADAATDLDDYYLELVYLQGDLNSRPVEIYTYQNQQIGTLRVRHFYAPRTGQCRVTVRSHSNPEITDTAIITVVDPVEKFELDRDFLPTMIALPTGRNAVVIDAQNVVKEYRLSSYSKDKYRLRSLTERESLVAIPNSTVFSNQLISVRYELRGDNGVIDSYTRTDCVLVPDFTLRVEGNYPDVRWTSVSNQEVKRYRENVVNNASSGSKEFMGYLPNVTAESPRYLPIEPKASDVTLRVNDNSVADDYRIRKAITEGGDLVITVEYIYRIKGGVYPVRVGTFTLKCGSDWVWQYS